MSYDRADRRYLLGYRLHLTIRGLRDLVPGLRRVSLRRPYYDILKYLYPQGIPVALSTGQKVRLHPPLLGIIKPETYEARLAKLFVNFVSPGGLVLDVGAHVGLHTMLFNRLVGAEGRVLAVEPSPVNVSLLQKHLAWNQCRNVEVIEAAIGDREDLISFRFWPDPTSGYACENSLGSERGEPAKVRMTTIDALCVGNKPDLIKIDVEGAEFLVLQGARETLTSAAPVVVVAIHPREMRVLNSSPAELILFLAECGYEGRHLDGRRATNAEHEELVFRKAALGV